MLSLGHSDSSVSRGEPRTNAIKTAITCDGYIWCLPIFVHFDYTNWH